MKTSKKINAGDTLTVGDLTDDYLGAVIEVETLFDITYRFTLGSLGDDWYSQRSLWTPKVRVESFYPNTQVKVITPPPVVQPDEPTILGQLVRIEGDDDWLGMVADPEDKRFPILDTGGDWCSWRSVLSRAGDRQIIVSDPPRWPDETPEVPERIEEGEWKWVGRDDDPWTRGNRVEAETGPKAGDVFTSIEDMPYGWVAKAADESGKDWGYVVREDSFPQSGLQHTHRWSVSGYGAYSVLPVSEWASFGRNSVSGRECQSYTLVETVEDHDARVAQDNS